jgi:hypothetical protein
MNRTAAFHSSIVGITFTSLVALSQPASAPSASTTQDEFVSIAVHLDRTTNPTSVTQAARQRFQRSACKSVVSAVAFYYWVSPTIIGVASVVIPPPVFKQEET